MPLLPVKKGISSYAVTSVPKEWDQQWFRYFIDNFLANADIRNAATTGIVVSGNVSGNTTTGNVNTNVTVSLSPIANNTVLGNVSGATAVPVALNSTQLTTLINIFTSTLSGAVPGSGGGTTNFLRADGTWANPLAASGANPTAKVGPVVVNGVATTYMRSDAAPPIDLTASYAWTGTHTFSIPIPVASGGTGTSTPSLVNGTGISITGSWPNQTVTNTVSSPIGADPTAAVSTTAVNGVATTFMRSDGAPPINQGINPTWSGNHIFTPSNGVAITANGVTGHSAIVANGASGTGSITIASGSTTGFGGGDLGINRSASTANSFAAGPCIRLEDTSGADFSGTWQVSGGQVEFWAGNGASQNQLAFWNSSRKLTLNAASSGVTLNVNGNTGAGGFYNSAVNGNANTTMDLQNSSTGAAANAYLRILNSADSAAFGIASTGNTAHFFTGDPGAEMVFFGTVSNIPITIGSNSIERLRITAAGNLAINAPTSGDALAITNVAGANALTINGNAAGTAVVRFNTQGTTGAQTASFSATNKPGAANGSPQSWLPVNIDGTTRYIPCFS